MKNNLPKYLISSDPFDTEEPDEFFIHTESPSFLAKVYPISFGEIEKESDQVSFDMLYLNPEGEIEVFRFEMAKTFDTVSEDSCYETLAAAEEWYYNYVAEGDEEETGESGSLIKDFSKDMPGLKIIVAEDRSAVISKGFYAEFVSENELEEFLVNELGISAEMLDAGMINKVE